MSDISDLLEIMRRLRARDGCPWDRQQTFQSIAPYTLEEACEVVDVIESGRLDALSDELGDLLFQVVFHAQMADEADLFAFDDVVTAICGKMRRRHPHVFGDASVDSAAAQTREWESHKRHERDAGGARRVLDGIAVALPALVRAAKLGRRAASVGFDWPDARGAREKVGEELAEVDAAIAAGDGDEVRAELGDLLFAVVNLCRHLDVDPEQSLREANRRFATRFERVEDAVAAGGRSWKRLTPIELDALWEEAKRSEAAT